MRYLLGFKMGLVHNIGKYTIPTKCTKYSRNCVVINLKEPITTYIDSGSFKQFVEYENIHFVCFSSRKVGHEQYSCKAQEPSSLAALNPHTDEGLRPCVVVSFKNKKRGGSTNPNDMRSNKGSTNPKDMRNNNINKHEHLHHKNSSRSVEVVSRNRNNKNCSDPTSGTFSATTTFNI